MVAGFFSQVHHPHEWSTSILNKVKFADSKLFGVVHAQCKF